MIKLRSERHYYKTRNVQSHLSVKSVKMHEALKLTKYTRIQVEPNRWNQEGGKRSLAKMEVSAHTSELIEKFSHIKSSRKNTYFLIQYVNRKERRECWIQWMMWMCYIHQEMRELWTLFSPKTGDKTAVIF